MSTRADKVSIHKKHGREFTVTQIGETLLILQKVDRFLAAILMNMASANEADQKLEKILLRDKETLGQLMAHFKNRVTLPATFAADFEALLEDRNIFVHNLFMQPWFDLNTAGGCERIGQFILGISKNARTALKVMMASQQSEAVDPNCSIKAQAYIHDVLLRVEETAHPDVLASTTAQSIEDLRQDVLANFSTEKAKG